MSAQFDAKIFNAEAFAHYMGRVPYPNKNELIKSKVMVVDSFLKNLLSSQTGSFYGLIPMHGLIGGEPVNYDGNTDIEATSVDTYQQGVIAVGRAKAWTEKDFSVDITAGVDFMSEIAKQVGTYWDEQDTKMIMSIIKGIFSMTGAKNLEFVNKHTFDITEKGDGVITATTLNSALQQASGDKKAKFSLVFMHSAVATNLENLNLLTFLTQNDANGIARPLPLAHWNGRLVIVDDGMPTEDVAESAEGAGDGYTKYTSFVFGEGAIHYADLGVEVPYEMDRDPAKNGGQDTLYTRQRKAYMPHGISFTNKSVKSFSPTNAELETGSNWELVKSTTNEVFDHKQIAIARIISRG